MTMDSLHSDDYSLDRSTRYIKLHRIGEGAFGEVKLGRSRCSGEFVALKSIKAVSGVNRSPFFSNETGGSLSSLLPKASFRELEALRQLPQSPYIVKLLDVYPEETKIVLVLEYAITDLSVLITKARRRFDLSFVKHVSIGILCGLSHIHHHGLIHRDIKPSNILFSCAGVPKIGDFGLCRIYDKTDNASMSHQVATRWYRAPELLFASRHYGPEVDVWSAGVVIAETIALTPLFPGINDIDQMSKVFQVMGSPNYENWPGAKDLPDFSKVIFPVMQPLNLRVVLPLCSPSEEAFLRAMLQLDPARRLPVDQIIEMGYLFETPSGVLPASSSVFRALLSELGLCASPEEVVRARSAALTKKVKVSASAKEFDSASTFKLRLDTLLSNLPMP